MKRGWLVGAMVGLPAAGLLMGMVLAQGQAIGPVSLLHFEDDGQQVPATGRAQWRRCIQSAVWASAGPSDSGVVLYPLSGDGYCFYDLVGEGSAYSIVLAPSLADGRPDYPNMRSAFAIEAGSGGEAFFIRQQDPNRQGLVPVVVRMTAGLGGAMAVYDFFTFDPTTNRNISHVPLCWANGWCMRQWGTGVALLRPDGSVAQAWE